MNNQFFKLKLNFMRSKLKQRCMVGVLFIIFNLAVIPLWAQQKMVSGLIEDSNGKPIPGVSVYVDGTKQGTVSNANGMYEIAIRGGKTLVFSFVGMVTEKIELGDNTVINVKMKEDDLMLDEVVAIGYGSKSKATTTGAVGIVTAERFANKPVHNTAELLQGLVPGMEIRRVNQGKVGEEGYSVQIRGVTSRSNPGILIVLDGIPSSDNGAGALNRINPEDIENITILKDAQAAIYGARAAGGVLLITTKKGKSEKPTIVYTGNYSFNNPVIMPQKVNVLEHIDMMGELYANDGIASHAYTHLLPYVGVADIYSTTPQVVKGPFGDTPDLVLGYHDWWNEMYGVAFDKSHTLTISGKTNKTNYYTSVGYLDQSSMFQFGDHNNESTPKSVFVFN